ncbi:MAG: response regulator transcription factor [Burkholderiales bacterium]|nr:response regulator transcription factor [Burkholderiales bacterium]
MSGRPIRVLIADDHPLFLEGVASSLAASSDFDVVAQAPNGAEAVSLALQLQPDLALLDVSMPVMDGIEAAARLSAHLPGLRIMMLTVSETPESLLSALKAGAHGYVLKGVSASELRTIAANLAAGEAYVSPSLAAEMLTEFSRPREPDQFSTLTPRETDVLALLSQGLSNRAIAESLHLAEKTVKHHMTVILQKLQVRSRTEAALLAVQRGVPRSDRR